MFLALKDLAPGRWLYFGLESNRLLRAGSSRGFTTSGLDLFRLWTQPLLRSSAGLAAPPYRFNPKSATRLLPLAIAGPKQMHQIADALELQPISNVNLYLV
ncbi:MAG: hypothetical protein A2283_16730 [Lentisphaerae bacterium RIFOXYA12_FULL_48_11]|nr:MAG: hypothetical protein A2283_16730 [Lentisphaerae bacterium RIFOXYA12_FULL_48_11]